MAFFVTGGTGLIGRFLVDNLLERDRTIFLLVRPSSEDKYEDLLSFWDEPDQLEPVYGDITDPDVIQDSTSRERVQNEITDVYHLAAVYDMDVDAETARKINVEGTSNLVDFVNNIDRDITFNHVSSIAVAGDHDGLFREDHFNEGQNFKNPYMRTKFESERVVRESCSNDVNIFRPGIVVGSSETGYMDKINGPYYFFKLIQKIRDSVPRWLPLVGLEGSEVQLAPVDYTADAIDYISNDATTDSSVFHLVDPDPPSLGDTVNEFFKAARGPELNMRIDKRLFNFLPTGVIKQVASLPMVEEVLDRIADSLGVPRSVFANIEIPATFDDRNTHTALEETEIDCPRLEDYAWRLWDYWERHLDPALHYRKNFREEIEGKNVVVTGASSGIGRSVALKAGRNGAEVMLMARSEDDLNAVKDEIEKNGDGSGNVYPCDLTNYEDVDETVAASIDEHGPIDVLVNNAGRSIRRSAERSLERFHDYERTMKLNYFGSLRMIKNALPGMLEQRDGHIINISSIGVLANSPRFSAYVGSKAALDAFSKCMAPEVTDKNVDITTIYMPLVSTPMIEPTKIYDFVPTLTPDEAADLVVEAVVDRPKRIATKLGTFAEILYAVSPKFSDAILNLAYRLFPSTATAEEPEEELSPEGVAFAHLLKGIHW
ncbi:MAG: SDR family oxidoreductase [bacterium]